MLDHLRKLASACREVTAGRFDVRGNLVSPDEIGGIVDAFKMMIEQTSEVTTRQAGAYENIDESMGSINQAFYEILDGTDMLVKNCDDILKFTGHLLAIPNKFDKKDHLQIVA